jgi:predicted esterase
MLFRKKVFSLLIPAVVLLCAPVFLNSCGKKQATTDCEQLQAVNGDKSLTVGYIEPSKGLLGLGDESTLVLYLHGLSANWQQPFQFPWKHTYADTVTHFRPGITFMSMQYGGSGKWVDETAFENITCGIRTILKKYPSEKIVLAGCSMGASSALSYTEMAPEDIKKKIVGVVAMYPAGDFIELHEKTATPVVKTALEGCFGGKPDNPEAKKRYQDLSPITNLDKFPKTTRVAVISASQDVTIPPKLQETLVEALKKKDIVTHFESVKCSHELPPPHKSFYDALKFAIDGN